VPGVQLTSGTRVLVTGASRGIGKAVADAFERRACVVGRVSRSGELAADVADRDSLARAIERFGAVDVLVANAGILFQGSIEATPEDVFRELLEVNLTALFRVSRSCFEAMQNHGGSMIHIASDAGIRAVHEIAAYSVTKAGVIAVSELFGAEGAPYGIRSNAVCPGDIVPGVQATPTGHEDHAEDPAGWVLPPSGRFGTGDDVAALVAWLSSDDSAHMTGATLRIDGGTGAAMRVLTRG